MSLAQKVHIIFLNLIPPLPKVSLSFLVERETLIRIRALCS